MLQIFVNTTNYVQFVSDEQRFPNKEEIKSILIRTWAKRQQKENGQNDKNKIDDQSENNISDMETKHAVGKWSTNWFEQFYLLLIRACKHRKGGIISKIRFSEMTSVAIISGLIWFQMDKRERNISDWVGSIFFINTYVLFCTMFVSIVHFPLEKDVIKRERQSGTYRLSAYYFAKLLAELPVDIILPIWSVTIAYWMIGINNNFVAFLLYLLTTILGVAAANAFGTFLGCCLTALDRAITAMAVCGWFMLLCGGFYIQENEIPDWISWLKYVSFMRYMYYIVLYIIFTDAQFECDNPSAFGKCNENSNVTLNRSDILDYLQIDEPVWQSAIFLVISVIVWHCLAYYFLRRSTSIHQ